MRAPTEWLAFHAVEYRKGEAKTRDPTAHISTHHMPSVRGGGAKRTCRYTIDNDERRWQGKERQSLTHHANGSAGVYRPRVMIDILKESTWLKLELVSIREF